jgi:hypothetical protein
MLGVGMNKSFDRKRKIDIFVFLKNKYEIRRVKSLVDRKNS